MTVAGTEMHRSTARTVVKNWGVVFAAQSLAKVLGFIWLILLARYLGDAGFGKISFAIAFTALFIPAFEFGLSDVTIREVARRHAEASSYFRHVLVLKVLLATAVLPLLALVAILAGVPRETSELVGLVAVGIVLNSLFSNSVAIFYALEKMEFPAIITVTSKALCVVIGTGLLLARARLAWIAGVIALESLFNLVAGSLLVRGFLSRSASFSFDHQFWRRLLKAAYPFALAAALAQVCLTMDTVILNHLKGDAVTGWYNAANRLVMSLLFLPGVFVTVVFPVLSRVYGISREVHARGVRKAFEMMLLLACPAGIWLAIYRHQVIGTLYGAPYAASERVLGLVGLGATFLFLNYLSGVILGSMDQQHILFYVTAAGAVLSVLLNLLLIPRFAHLGAAAAALTTQTVLALLYGTYLWRQKVQLARPGHLLRVLVSVLVMILAVRPVAHAHLAILVMLSALVYLGALVATRVLGREDLDLLKQALARR